MAIINNVLLARGVDLALTPTLIYQVPMGINRAVINRALIQNSSASPVNATFWLVSAGTGARADKHKVLIDKILAPTDNYSISEMVGNVLEYDATSGQGAIYGEASQASVIHTTLSGSTASTVNSTGIAYGLPFVKSYEIPSLATACYTLPAGILSAQITKAMVTNTTGSASLLSLWIGSVNSGANRQIQSLSIGANESVILMSLQNAQVDSKIYASSSVASALKLNIFGTEYAA